MVFKCEIRQVRLKVVACRVKVALLVEPTMFMLTLESPGRHYSLVLVEICIDELLPPLASLMAAEELERRQLLEYLGMGN